MSRCVLKNEVVLSPDSLTVSHNETIKQTEDTYSPDTLPYHGNFNPGFCINLKHREIIYFKRASPLLNSIVQ